jgi:DNA-directed RNA polymerase subunit RPC12/RpoP
MNGGSTMDDKTINYQCPNCSGALYYDASGEKITCKSCKTEYSYQQIEEYGLALDASEKPSKINWHADEYKSKTEIMDDKPGYVCESCGAEIVADENTAATECIYCGNPVIVPKTISGMLMPDYVIPFKIEKDSAKKLLADFYGKRFLLPKEFKDKNRIKKISGVYVPFWLFDCKGEGNAAYRATRMRSWSDSNYNYTETKHYSIIRSGSVGFSNIPVDASSKMEDKYMDAIEPFDYNEFEDFKALYLAGYFADKYDVDVDDSIARATLRVKNSTDAAFRSTINGYTSVTTSNSNIQMEEGDIHYALLPIWMLNTKYKDEMYQFAINGQTGKVVGELPVDKGKAVQLFMFIFIIVSLVAFTIMKFLV